MLTGQKVFAGEDISVTLSKVIQVEPDWSALPQQTPAPLHRLLRRCLHKEPKARLRDVGDARVELEDALATPSPESASAALPARHHDGWRRASPLVAASAVGAAVAVLVGGMCRLERAERDIEYIRLTYR